MKFKIINRPMAGIFQGEEPYILISIADPQQERLRRLVRDRRLKDTLYLHFYDLELPYVTDTHLKENAFSEKQAEEVLTFTEKWKDKVKMICIN